jgi:hypothetical protein
MLRKLVILLLLFLTMPIANQSAYPAEQEAKNVNDSAPSPLKFTVSKETTFLTEPLRPDGRIDYLKAMNDRLSAGVTPENNAAIELIEALGPVCLFEKNRRETLAHLGLADLPEHGDYLVSLHDFHKANHVGKDLKGNDIGEKWEDAFFTQEGLAESEPWSKREYPLLAAWIDSNERAFHLVIAGSRKSRYYVPIVDEQYGNLCGTAIAADIMEIRDVVRFLRIHAMNELDAGRPEEAWHDVLACCHWASLQSQGPMTTHRLVATGLEGIAHGAVTRMVGSRRLSAQEAVSFLRDLDRVPPWPSVQAVFDVGERFYTLDSFQNMSINGYDPKPLRLDLPGGEEFIRPFEAADRATKRLANDPRLDWNEALRYYNSRHDQVLKVWNCPDPAEQKELAKVFQRDLSASREKDLEMIFSEDYARTATPVTLARHLVEMGGSQISEVQLLEENEARRKVLCDLSRLALALAGYHAEHAAYPQAIADLCPKFLATASNDSFSDKPFRYKPEKDSYLLYSVGPNRIDDGGRNYFRDHETAEEFERATEEEKACDDIAIRMPLKP